MIAKTWSQDVAVCKELGFGVGEEQLLESHSNSNTSSLRNVSVNSNILSLSHSDGRQLGSSGYNPPRAGKSAIHLPAGMFPENGGLRLTHINLVTRNSKKYCYSLAIKFQNQSSPNTQLESLGNPAAPFSPGVIKGAGDTGAQVVTPWLHYFRSNFIVFWWWWFFGAGIWT